MIFAKDTPIGKDAVIAQAQISLMKLATTWGVELDGYPRCYPKLDTEQGRKGIEYYDKENEYSKSLIHAEGNKFFFTAEEKPKPLGNGYYTARIELYFILNLKECKPSISHRADEEVHADVDSALKNVNYAIEIDGFVTEIEDVFDGYYFEHGDDLQPYHAFRVDLTAFEYKSTETLCILN